MQKIYAGLCLAGFVIPYFFLVQFLRLYGLNLAELARQMFGAPIAAFFVADVIISSLAFWAWMYQDTRRRPVRLWWLCIAANLIVGLSLALPLYLYLREGPTL